MNCRWLLLLVCLTIGWTSQAIEVDWLWTDAEELHSLSLTSEIFYPSDDTQSIGVEFPIFEELKGEELKRLLPLLQQVPLCDSLLLTIHRGMERKKACWEVSFLPFIYKNQRYYKLISFDWKLRETTSLVLYPPAASANFTSLQEGKALNDASRYAAHSRLSTGSWHKLSVEESGVYRLDYSDIRKMGYDPEKVQIYGYGGALLSEDFRADYLDDLPEVPIYHHREGNCILFYAQGPLSWEYLPSEQRYHRVNNHYSKKAFYFVSGRSEGSLEMEREHNQSPTSLSIDRYTERLLHEVDLVNLGTTGRECYGEDFSTLHTRDFSFDAKNLCLDEASSISLKFVARNSVPSVCRVSLGDDLLGQMTFSPIQVNDAYTYGRQATLTRSFLPKSTSIEVRLDYRNNGALPKAAHLDYIELNLRCSLVMRESVLLFRDHKHIGRDSWASYQIASADPHTIVLDVTHPCQTKLMEGKLEGDRYSFVANTLLPREFAAVNTHGFIAKPTIEGRVPNQNLHALPPQDFVIIAHPDFMLMAEELAEAHRRYQHLRCVVVSSEQVYNEFSSGTPDATAYRRFMKMFYDRAENETDLPQSLLLFGDGVYDNRLVTSNFANVSNPPNKLLTYQSRTTLEGTSSFVSDDYFGFLDDTEGVNLASDMLDIGIGRFPVRTQVEARTAVDKSIAYLQNKDKGSWKNQICFLSDDGDNNTHISHADRLAETVRDEHPEFVINKIYVDAYPRVTTASGTTVPDANRRFSELLDAGLLMLNYSGHGSTTTWASEGLLTIKDIKSMQNARLPLWVTATCDFCRYDDYETSGGEYVFLNQKGGAVALFTTSRVVYSGPNFTLNKAFVQTVFSKVNGKRLSLGEVMCRTKQSSLLRNDRNKLNFALIGDPALCLGYPDYRASINRINGHAVDDLSRPDTLKALSTARLAGVIHRSDGSLADDFEGVIDILVFDAEESNQTLGNDGNDVFHYQSRDKVLYSGKASVQQGRFEFSFIVPKDLSYSYQNGQINLYAYSLDGQAEAQGLFEAFLLGGTDPLAIRDSIGPAIRLFLNDTSFIENGVVNTQPTLIAHLSDLSGLNTSGNSIGHDLMLVLDGQQKFNLNHYYESDLNSHTSGKICFNLPELTEGQHVLSLKAWDMQNNSSTHSLVFQVKKDSPPHILQFDCLPTSQGLSFWFSHDRPKRLMETNLRIFDVMGRERWSTQLSMMNRHNQSDQIEWNYVGKDGHIVENGVYICRLLIDLGDGQQAVATRKIIVAIQ